MPVLVKMPKNLSVKMNCSSAATKKNLRPNSTNSLLYIHHSLFLDVFIYTLKWTCFMLADLSSKVRIFINLNFIFDFKLLTTSMVNLMYFYYFSYHLNGQPYVFLLFSYHLNIQPYVFLLFFLPPQWPTLCIFIIFLLKHLHHLKFVGVCPPHIHRVASSH